MSLLEQYDRIKVIGKGSYGEVWLAKHKKDRKQYVLKKVDMRKASKRERKAAEQEAQLLSEMKHPNIVAYKESFEAEDGFLYISMGFCEGGDLYNRLKEQKGVYLEERQVVEWFVQIAMALQYMHGKNIMHRDLKTQNIFLTKSKVIKVGDLGIARVLDSSTDMATTMIGTPYYMSPELFSNKPYNFKSDVWALGCCVYEMATLKHAFNGRDMNSLMYKILRGKMPPVPSVYTVDLHNLVRAMLNKTAEKRPSVSRILRDPYIKKNIALFLEETRAGPASVRQSGADCAKPRPTSTPGCRLKQSDAAGRPKAAKQQERKVRKAPRPVEKLEPLHIGPDLEPIKEEPTPRDIVDACWTPVSSVPRHSDEATQKDDSKVVENAQIKLRRKKNADKSSYSVINSPIVFVAEPPSITALISAARELPPISAVIDNEPCQVATNSTDMNNVSPAVIMSQLHDSAAVIVKPVVSRQFKRPAVSSSHQDGIDRFTQKPGVSAASQPVVYDVAAAGDMNDPCKIDCNQIDVTNNSVVEEHLLKPLPRVLPPRPSSTKTPVISRVRPHSAHSIVQSAAVETAATSASSPSSSNSSNLTDENSPANNKACVSKSADTETRSSMSARERRRKKKEVETVANSVELMTGSRLSSVLSVEYEQPVVSKSYHVDSSGYGSYTDSADLDQHSPKKQVHSSIAHSNSAPSLSIAQSAEADDNSSTGSSSEVEGRNKNDKKQRKDPDMKDLITLMLSTLQQPPKKTKPLANDADVALPIAKKPLANLGMTFVVSTPSVFHTAEDSHSVNSVAGQDSSEDENECVQPNALESGISLTTGGRLLERITFLRKDCIQRLGVTKLSDAYKIIDGFRSEEVAPQLVHLLGQSDFDEFAGKIYQLKFYEECAFGCGED